MMVPNPPQTLSVKRKRDERPVDSLVLEEEEKVPSIKRQKSEMFAWRLLPQPGHRNLPSRPAQDQQPEPYSHKRLGFFGGKVLESREQDTRTATNGAKAEPIPKVETPAAVSIPDPDTPRPRKRPGASTALHGVRSAVTENKEQGTEPSEEQVREFEQFSAQVEESEHAQSQPPPSPLKFQPRVPALRYRDRHPEKAAALAAQDPDAMDIDDYVIDTYIREIIVPGADGKIPSPQGTVGIIVLAEEDEEFWNGEDESDRELATDDEDENAEEYYANDYPEDELSSDDEFNRNLYKPNYRKGSDDEEYNLDESSDEEGVARSDGDEDDEHYRRIARPTAPGYWVG